jgi:Spy/CpxP family protein refolding chaperone
MRKVVFGLIAAATCAVLACPAMAQDRPRPPRPGFNADNMPAFNLLTQKPVQDELKLSEDQLAKIKAESAKQEKAMQELREQGLGREEQISKRRELNQQSDKAAEEILKPDQLKRLQQIRLQLRQTRAFQDEKVAKELNLTEDQKTKIKEIQDDAGRQRRGLRGEENLPKLREINQGADEKIMSQLTAEQKAKWKEMTGTPFKLDQLRAPGGPGGRRPDGGRRPPVP